MIDIAATPFANIADLIALHAQHRPHSTALIEGERHLDYAELDATMNRVARALQAHGLRVGDAVAVCAAMSVEYAVVFLGALRAGVAVAPLSPSASTGSLRGMWRDAGARLLFADDSTLAVIATQLDDPAQQQSPVVALDDGRAGTPLSRWLAPHSAAPLRVDVPPDTPFNLIYSSGTTGEPKGIVQPHSMRWAHVHRALRFGYTPHSVTLTSTPLYSNTTLVVLFPTLAFGGCAVLMPKFDAQGFLQRAERHRATHAMLVPVQYQRLMALPGFERFDLSSFHMKFCTSAPFPAALKADVLARWPGGLIEFYGMTEGGGTCLLDAHRHPTKLHTVGQPQPGHDIRLIDDAGREVGVGEAGEVVGHSAGMMTGYHGKPDKTREAEWHAPDGKRFIRTGDIGRFDEDGFLILLDRKKDMIISGGFNLYPSDLEAVLREHPAVHDVSVIGVPSPAWGETPVAYAALRPGHLASAGELQDWCNQRVGKVQRLSDLRLLPELPRNAIGKVLKRELRELYTGSG